MKLNKVLAFAFAGMMTLGLVCLAGCAGGKTDTGNGYEISNQAMARDENDLDCLHARVKNTCGRTETLMISWDLFDKNGNKIGTALGVAEDLPDGQTIEIDAVTMPDDTSMVGEMDKHVESFELTSVSFMKAEVAALEAKNAELEREIEREKR